MVRMVFIETNVRQSGTVRRVLGEVDVARGGLAVRGDRTLHQLVLNVQPNPVFRLLSPKMYAWMVAGQFRTPHLQVKINQTVEVDRMGKTREAWHRLEQ